MHTCTSRPAVCQEFCIILNYYHLRSAASVAPPTGITGVNYSVTVLAVLPEIVWVTPPPPLTPPTPPLPPCRNTTVILITGLNLLQCTMGSFYFFSAHRAPSFLSKFMLFWPIFHSSLSLFTHSGSPPPRTPPLPHLLTAPTLI